MTSNPYRAARQVERMFGPPREPEFDTPLSLLPHKPSPRKNRVEGRKELIAMYRFYPELGEAFTIPAKSKLVRIVQEGHPFNRVEVAEEQFLKVKYQGDLYFLRRTNGTLMPLWGKDGKPPYETPQS